MVISTAVESDTWQPESLMSCSGSGGMCRRWMNSVAGPQQPGV